MSQLQRAIQRELDDFIKNIREPGASLARVSKSSFCRARRKLKHGAFIELGKIILDAFYSKDNFPSIKTWKGYRLIGVDGTTAEVPNSREIQEEFGVHAVRPDGKKISMARICELYDPLNHLNLAGKIAPFVKSETSLFYEMLQSNGSFGKGDVFIFDRYFYSSALAFYLLERGADFCFRVKKNLGEVKEMLSTNQQEAIFELTLKKKSKKKASELGIVVKRLSFRLVHIKLDSGEDEFLLTSLTDAAKVSIADLKQLYAHRWGVEENYKKLKHKVCIENFSGKSVESIYQDYYAKLYIINLTAVLIQPVDKVLEEKPKKKFIHKVNYTEALSKMKTAPICLFIQNKAEQTIAILHQWFIKRTEPIRPDRKFKRTKLPKRKYPLNYKQT